MRKITVIALLFVFVACKHQTQPDDKRDAMKKIMIDYLYKNNKKFDSTQVKYEILDMVYVENPGSYVCQFKVHVHDPEKDTTGIMNAAISKDLTKIINRY